MIIKNSPSPLPDKVLNLGGGVLRKVLNSGGGIQDLHPIQWTFSPGIGDVCTWMRDVYIIRLKFEL